MVYVTIKGRPKRQWIDDIEEWNGCSYIQPKEMSQDREQWRRKTIEWSSAVANRHRRWSTTVLYCTVLKSDVLCKFCFESNTKLKALYPNYLLTLQNT